MVEKLVEKKLAIKLRKEGLTYVEILKQVPVAKSSLSLWLRSIGLAEAQKQRVTEKRLLAQKKATARVREIRIEKTKIIKEKAFGEIPLLKRDLLWAVGLVLYWAEGTKNKKWSMSTRIQLCNMDSNVIMIFLDWVKKYLDVADHNLVYELYIHRSANLNLAKKYWAKELGIQEKIIRVYNKKTNPNPHRGNRGAAYHGLMKVRIKKVLTPIEGLKTGLKA